MDGDRFDAWTKSLATGASRRRVLAGLGALAGGLLGRGVAAQEVGVASCRERLALCDRRGQCCEAQEGHRIGCARVSERCFRDVEGERCCGRGGAKCADACACCAGFECREGSCRPFEPCEENTCCDCYRCSEQDERCEHLFCRTGLTGEECRERCRRRNGEAFFAGRNWEATWTCRRYGCDIVCPEGRGEEAGTR